MNFKLIFNYCFSKNNNLFLDIFLRKFSNVRMEYIYKKLDRCTIFYYLFKHLKNSKSNERDCPLKLNYISRGIPLKKIGRI